MDERDAGAAPSIRASAQDATKQNIIEVAMEEFATKGLDGARVDEIARRTKTSKRMIYYYFGGKEDLYVAVLEEAFRRLHEVETGLRLDHLAPEDAIGSLVGFTFDYLNDDPSFVRLVMTENIHRAAHLARSSFIRELSVPVIETVHRVLEHGQQTGAFRSDIDALDLYATIRALCFFNVANRHTFSILSKRDLGAPEELARRRQSIIETVLRTVRR